MKFLFVVVVQLLSCVLLLATPWTTARQASLSTTNYRSLLKLMSIALVRPSNHLILCPPFLLWPSIFPIIRVISNESVLCIRWPKYWSFSFSTSPSNEYSGLVSFRMDWLDFLVVQGTHPSKKTNPSIFFFFLFLATLCGMWDLNSLIRDQTCASCTGSAESWPLDWTAREAPNPSFLLLFSFTTKKRATYRIKS